MRPIVITELISLDGVVEAPSGSEHAHVGWTFKDVECDPAAYESKGTEQEEAPRCFSGASPTPGSRPSGRRWMTSRRTTPCPRSSFRRPARPPRSTPSGLAYLHLLTSLDDVSSLRRAGSHGDGSRFAEVVDGPVLVHGAPTLAKSLAAAGLVDHYTLLTFPVILDHGTRLFADDGVETNLTLTQSAHYSNSIQLSIFDVAR